MMRIKIGKHLILSIEHTLSSSRTTAIDASSVVRLALRELPQIQTRIVDVPPLDSRVQTILTEYIALRSEIQYRTQLQHDLFKAHVSTIILVFGAILASIVLQDKPQGLWLIAIIPLEASMFGLWHLWHAIYIEEIGGYVKNIIEPRISHHVTLSKALWWETYHRARYPIIYDVNPNTQVERIGVVQLAANQVQRKDAGFIPFVELITYYGPAMSALIVGILLLAANVPTSAIQAGLLLQHPLSSWSQQFISAAPPFLSIEWIVVALLTLVGAFCFAICISADRQRARRRRVHIQQAQYTLSDQPDTIAVSETPR